MLLSRSAALLLSGMCVLPTVAVAAGRQPQDFVEPAKMTEEEIAAAKARSRSNLNGYEIAIQERSTPIPWMFIGMSIIAFVSALPFALKSYKKVSRELTGANTFGSGPRGSGNRAD